MTTLDLSLNDLRMIRLLAIDMGLVEPWCKSFTRDDVDSLPTQQGALIIRLISKGWIKEGAKRHTD